MNRELSEIAGRDEALAFVEDAYRTRLRRAGRTVEHPVAVAGMLADDAQPPRVVVAGILHDVLEDTGAPARARDAIRRGRRTPCRCGDSGPVDPEVPRAQGGAAPPDRGCRRGRRRGFPRRQGREAREPRVAAREAKAPPLPRDPPRHRAALRTQPAQRDAARGAGSVAGCLIRLISRSRRARRTWLDLRVPPRFAAAGCTWRPARLEPGRRS